MAKVALEALIVGQKYRYSRPGWNSQDGSIVEIELQNEEKVVRFKKGYYPTKLKDFPADAQFEQVD